MPETFYAQVRKTGAVLGLDLVHSEVHTWTLTYTHMHMDTYTETLMHIQTCTQRHTRTHRRMCIRPTCTYTHAHRDTPGHTDTCA